MDEIDSDELLETLGDVINQACLTKEDELDSMAIGAYSNGILLLKSYDKVEIIHRSGRRIIAKWKEGVQE